MDLEEQRQFILAGNMYNDLTEELVKARENTVLLTNEYNASFGRPAEEREAILRKLLKSIGTDVYFEPSFRCEFGYNISIGAHFYANFDCVMLDGGGIEIGDHVLFGPRVGIYTSNHAVDAWERVPPKEMVMEDFKKLSEEDGKGACRLYADMRDQGGDWLAKYGAHCSGCMTVHTFETALHANLNVPKQKNNQRNGSCACLLGVDIGVYDTCGHLCKYGCSTFQNMVKYAR